LQRGQTGHSLYFRADYKSEIKI